MKTLHKGLLLAFCLLLSVTGTAQTGTIAGTWTGKLEAAPGSSITVNFVLSQDAGGAWSTVLNSPDSGAIKNIKATTTSFDGTTLDIKVDALSGAYSGKLTNGNFNGQWTQPGGKLPMNLAPFKVSVLSDAAKASLLGEWHGKLTAPGITLDMVLNFERNAAGEFVGTLNAPQQSPMKFALAELSFEKNELFFRIPQTQSEYRATFDGKGFKGRYKQGQEADLSFEKGAYVAEKITLALTEADYSKLKGKWTGTLGPITLVMRIEKAADGTIVAFMDSPTQNITGLKITKAALTGNTLEVASTVPPAQFSGELKDGTISGNWTQGPRTTPVSFKHE